MGAAASSSPPPPQEAAAASSSPPPPLEAAGASDPSTPAPEGAAPPAKEDPQHSTTAAAGGAAADAAEAVVLDALAVPFEGECGFHLFMKGGGCKEEFVAWQKCVEEAEAATGGGGVDVVERCRDIRAVMRKCMDAHADYYEPILRAERVLIGDLFEAEEAASDPAAPASEEGQEKQAANAEVLQSEEGQKKQAADAVASPSEEGQVKQPAEEVLSEESRDPADATETVLLDASAVLGEAGVGEEEQGECGFCLFMKGGGCKEEFVAWEKCVEEAEAAKGGVDVVERCHDITAALRKCMDTHADYYEPILHAERVMIGDLEAFEAQEAASNPTAPVSLEGQEKQAANAEVPLSEEGQKKQVASPSEEGQVKQPAEEVVSEESRDPAA